MIWYCSVTLNDDDDDNNDVFDNEAETKDGQENSEQKIFSRGEYWEYFLTMSRYKYSIV